MSRPILYYGNPALRTRCKRVEKIDEKALEVCNDLIEGVIEHNGAGLAAPQIGYFLRIFVARYGAEKDKSGRPLLLEKPKVYINPILSNPSKEQLPHNEGCLSLPDIYEEVNRPVEIDVEAMDIEGNPFVERATEWHAWVVMHENDHLNGVLLIDRLPLKRRKQLEEHLRALKKKYPYTDK